MKAVDEPQKRLLLTPLSHLFELKLKFSRDKKIWQYNTAALISRCLTYVACLTWPWLRLKLVSVIQLPLLYVAGSREVSRLEEVLLVQAHKQLIVFAPITS